ncbi:MAG TPA: hypothetical protein VIL37_14245 [Natronosporangium sp.]
MAEFLDYRFGEIAATNEVVRQRLADFRTTLDDFKTTYNRLAANWGGTAAEGAVQVSEQLDRFGLHTADIVQRFLTELNTHLEESQAVERTNTGLFTT